MHRKLLVLFASDVFLSAEAWLRGSNSAASASPRLFDTSPRSCLGLNVMTSKLRYDIIIHNFNLSILLICFQDLKTKLYLCIVLKQRFYLQAERVRCVCCLMNLV